MSTPQDLSQDENFKAFNEQMRSYLGIDVDGFKQIAGFVREQQREKALDPLRKEWGDDFDNRYSAIQTEFEKLPEDKRPLYDSVDGARMLWQSYEKSQASAPEADPSAQIPVYDRGQTIPNPTIAAASGAYRFKQSEILNLPAKDYEAQASDIAQAYASGQVDLGS